MKIRGALIAAVTCALLLGGASAAMAGQQSVTAWAKKGQGYAALTNLGPQPTPSSGPLHVLKVCDWGEPDGRRAVGYASFHAGGKAALQNKVEAAKGSGKCAYRTFQVRRANARRTIYIRACLRNGPRGRVYGCGRTQSLTPR
jgi:hypothetical protein